MDPIPMEKKGSPRGMRWEERSLLEGFPRQLIQAEAGLWVWPGKIFTEPNNATKYNIQAVIGETKRAPRCVVLQDGHSFILWLSCDWWWEQVFRIIHVAYMRSFLAIFLWVVLECADAWWCTAIHTPKTFICALNNHIIMCMYADYSYVVSHHIHIPVNVSMTSWHR